MRTDAAVTVDQTPTAHKRRRSATVVPAALLAMLIVGLLIFVIAQADAYGRTYDEALQDDYGKRTLAWYLSAGRDRSFLEYPDGYQMPQHGPFVETVVAAVQRLTGEDWMTRSIATGAFAILGVLAVALCGLELGGWWVALLSAVGLALYPRYTGAMFNNSKDLPFTAAMAFVLWLVLRLMRRWDGPGRAWVRASVGVGAAIGMASAIRAVAVIWFLPLALLAAGWWWRHGRKCSPTERAAALRTQALAGLLIGSAAWVTTALLWPYVLLSPVSHLLDSLRSMARYPWNGTIPFEGHMYAAQALPRRYVVEWLVIGSPLHTTVLAVVGLLLALTPLAARRPVDARRVLVLLYLVTPIILLAALHSTLYNGLRQFMFLVPAVVLFASTALVRLTTQLVRIEVARRLVACAAVVLAVGGQVEGLASMVRLHPYEYVYFSPVVGGFPGAVGQYELDYWGVCNKRAAEWLAQRHADPRSALGQLVTVDGNAVYLLYLNYLPEDRFTFSQQGQPPDYVIWSMRERDANPAPTYIEVHEEEIAGYPACIVQMRPDAETR